MTDPNRTLNLPPINARWLPEGKTTSLMLPPVPAHFYPLIGAVATFWGYFELRANDLLASFVEADQSDHDAGWIRRNFKKRSGLLKQKVAAHFPGPIRNEIGTILGTAAVYHWQRNLIVHGHLRCVNNPGLPVHAEGTHNGKWVKLPLTATSLEKLYHDIAILTSRIMGCTDPEREDHTLSSPDRSLLRAFVLKHPPNLPIPQMLASQTATSEG